MESLTVDDSYSIVRSCAQSFTINGFGYVGGGYKSGIRSDFWAYNPNTDVWTQVTSFEGTARQDAICFSMGNYGYVATGSNGSYYFDDIWVFDPTATYDSED
jgi:hypothetical protein